MPYNIVTFLLILIVSIECWPESSTVPENMRYGMPGFDDNRVHVEMPKAKLVPDIIRETPQHYIYIHYPWGYLPDIGVTLTPRQVKDEPYMVWQAVYYMNYTLCMIDADSPGTANSSLRKTFLHWLVVNIPGNTILLEMGDTLAQYIGPFPSKESGLHRYVFLLYQHSEKLNFDEPRFSNKSLVGRAEFSIQEFEEKYKLNIPPFAGNFFWSQWDDYVPELYESLDKGPTPTDVN